MTQAIFSNSGSWERSLRTAPAALRAEWNSLRREGDPELFGEGLLRLGHSLEEAGDTARAAELYAGIARARGTADLPGLRRRAEERLELLSGRGSFGARSEFLLRRLAQGAADPSAIFAMGAAGALFRVTRLATLARLSATPTAGIVTRGLGARALAGAAGFAVEAPGFTLASRLAGRALGREQDLSLGALARDTASGYLVLGGLRFAGGISGAAYSRFAAPVGAVREGPLRTLFQQCGMFSGILLGHAFEVEAGLRPAAGAAATLADSVATLLQFYVAGRLTRAAFGPRVAAWERGLDLRAEFLGRTPPSPTVPRPTSILDASIPRPLLAGAGRSSPLPIREAPVFMMSGPEGPRGSGRVPSIPSGLRESLGEELRLRIRDLRQRAASSDPESAQALRWNEEAEWLERAPTTGLAEFFESLHPLRSFYSRNMRLSGMDGLRWLQGMQERIFAEIRARDAYGEYLRADAQPAPNLGLPRGMSAPSTLPELPTGAGTVLRLLDRRDAMEQPLAYFRLTDLVTNQEVVSEGRLAEYRGQVRDRVDFAKPAQVGFHPRTGRWFLLDGHHRALAAMLEGRAFLLATQAKAFGPSANFRSLSELRRVSREEYEAVAERNERGAGMSESAMLTGFEGFEGLAGSAGKEAPSRGSWTEVLRRLFHRR